VIDDQGSSCERISTCAADGGEVGRLGEACAVQVTDRQDEVATSGAGGDRSASRAKRRAEIESTFALVHALQAQLLGMIRAAGEELDYVADGLNHLWEMVAHLGGLTAAGAREWCRTADALAGLPAIVAAFESGAVSWDKVRYAARFAEAGSDAHIASELPHHHADDIAYLAKKARAITRHQASEAEGAMFLRLRRNDDSTGMFLRGWMPGDSAARVAEVLEREAERLGPDDNGVCAPHERRLAEALEHIVADHQAAERDPDKASLIIRSDADVLVGERPGNAELYGDILIGFDTLRRLACDATVYFELTDGAGATIGVRRAHRDTPRWLRKLLQHRDRRCRFPGCRRRIRHFHHITYWTNGGRTDSDNLIGLCWHHHHLVHEGGWHIDGDADHTVDFVAPHGARLTSTPAPLDPKLRDRAERARRRTARRQQQRAQARASAPPC
jgi:hypothetical protein